MMDDVVDLTLVQVIPDLGLEPSSFYVITMVRPVAVSVRLALSVLLTCSYLVKPIRSSKRGSCFISIDMCCTEAAR